MTHSRFDLCEEPFEVGSTVCPPFASSEHQEIFNGLFLALLARKRILVLCGATGAGKTSLLKALLGHIEADGGLTLAVTAVPGMSVEDLIVAADTKLGPPAHPGVAGSRDIDKVVEELEDRLEDAGSGVLVVDEAHRLDESVIRDLVEFAQSDTETGRYMQVLLSGKPELEQILAESGLVDTVRRSGLISHMHALDREQVERFVQGRLHMAGAPDDLTFEPAALDLVALLTSGLPAVINPLCAQALREAENSGHGRVTRAHVAQAARRLGMDAPAPEPPPEAEIPEPVPPRRPKPSLREVPPAQPIPARDRPAAPEPRPSLRAETPHGRPKDKPRSSGRIRWVAMGATAILLGAGTGLALSESRPLDRLYLRVTGSPAPWSRQGADDSAALSPTRPGPQPTSQAANAGPSGATAPVRPMPAASPPAAAPEARPASPGAGPEAGNAGIAATLPDGQPDPGNRQMAALPPADLTPAAPPPPGSAAVPAPDTRQIAELVKQADRYLDARYLTTPAGTNAFETYQKIVALDPGNADAARILKQIKDHYLNWGSTAEAQGNTEDAKRYYERGLSVDPDDPALRVRLEGLTRRQGPAPQLDAMAEESAADTYPQLAPDQVLRLPSDYEGAPEPPAATSAPARTAEPNAFDTREAVLAALADPAVLDAVIRAGRDVNRELPDGKTPLILAAEQGKDDAIAKLLRAGAAPNARSQTGATALMSAAAAGDEAAVRALVQSGGAVNAMDVQGRTPLMMAAERGHLDTVRLLLDHGANINATTTHGESAYDLAASSGNAHVATLLRLRGAQASGSGSVAPIDLRTFRVN